METITVTGHFYDFANRPLTGSIIFRALPEYVINTPEDSIFAGEVVAQLKEDGSISQDLIASAGWGYEVILDLSTQDGTAVPVKRRYIKIPESGALPDFLALTLDKASTAPALMFAEDPDGEVTTINYQLAPDDPGAIIVPII